MYSNTLCVHRHTDEMIDKLESAGLGFRVRAKESQQKLGKTVDSDNLLSTLLPGRARQV